MNMAKHTNIPPFVVVAQNPVKGMGNRYFYLSGFKGTSEPIWCNSLRMAVIYDTIEDMLQHRSMVAEYWEQCGNLQSIMLCNLHKSHKVAKSVSDLVDL